MIYVLFALHIVWYVCMYLVRAPEDCICIINADIFAFSV